MCFVCKNGVLKLFPARRCSRGWILCADMLQGSLPIACVDSRSICPPACRARGGEERRGQLRVCPGLLLPNGRDPARKEAKAPGCGRSVSPSQLGDLRRSGREGRAASRPSSLREEGPRRPRPRPAGPQGYEEAEVPGLCSQELRPGTRRLLGQGGEKLSGAEHRPETIFLNRLFCLFKVRWQEKRRPN